MFKQYNSAMLWTLQIGVSDLRFNLTQRFLCRFGGKLRNAIQPHGYTWSRCENEVDLSDHRAALEGAEIPLANDIRAAGVCAYVRTDTRQHHSKSSRRYGEEEAKRTKEDHRLYRSWRLQWQCIFWRLEVSRHAFQRECHKNSLI